MNRPFDRLATLLVLVGLCKAAGTAHGLSGPSAFVSSGSLQAVKFLARVAHPIRTTVRGSRDDRNGRIGRRSLLSPAKAEGDDVAPPAKNKPAEGGQASTPAAPVPDIAPTSAPTPPVAPQTGSIKDAISAFSKGEIDKADLEKLVKEKETTELEAAEKRRVEALRQATETKRQIKTKERSDVIMVAIAGATAGLVAGGLGDGAFAGGDAPWAPPVSAVALGGVAYVAATQDGAIGETTRSVIGGFVARLLASIKAAAVNTIGSLKAAAANKVDETVEGIKAVPRNTQTAARKKADDLVKAVLKIPENIANSAKASVASAQENASAKVDSIVGDIKATPGNLQKESKKTGEAVIGELKKVPGKITTVAGEAATNTVNTVQTTVDSKVKELIAVPKKALEEVKAKIESVFPEPPKKEAAPKVAVLPPPAEVQESIQSVTLAPTAPTGPPVVKAPPEKTSSAKPAPKPAAVKLSTPKPAAKPESKPVALPTSERTVKPTATATLPKKSLASETKEAPEATAKKIPPLSAPLRTKSGASVASSAPKSAPATQAKPAPEPAVNQAPAKKIPPLSAPLRTKSKAAVASSSSTSTPTTQATKPTPPAPSAPASIFGGLFGSRNGGGRGSGNGSGTAAKAEATFASTVEAAPAKAKPSAPPTKASTSPFSGLFGGDGNTPAKKDGGAAKAVGTGTVDKSTATKRPMLSAPLRSQAPPKGTTKAPVADLKKAEPSKRAAAPSSVPKSTPPTQAAKPAPSVPKAPASLLGGLFGGPSDSGDGSGTSGRVEVEDKPPVSKRPMLSAPLRSKVPPKGATKAPEATTKKAEPSKMTVASSTPTSVPTTQVAKPSPYAPKAPASASFFDSFFGGPSGGGGGGGSGTAGKAEVADKPPVTKRPMLSAPLRSQAPPKDATKVSEVTTKKAEPSKKVTVASSTPTSAPTTQVAKPTPSAPKAPTSLFDSFFGGPSGGGGGGSGTVGKTEVADKPPVTKRPMLSAPLRSQVPPKDVTKAPEATTKKAEPSKKMTVALSTPTSTPTSQVANPAPSAPKAPDSLFNSLFGGPSGVVEKADVGAATAVKAAPSKAKPSAPTVKASPSPFSGLFGGGGNSVAKKDAIAAKPAVAVTKRPSLSSPVRSQDPPKAPPKAMTKASVSSTKKVESTTKTAPVKKPASGGGGSGLFGMFGGGAASTPAKPEPSEARGGSAIVSDGFFKPALAQQLLKKMDENQLKRLDAMTAKYANGGSPTAYVKSAAAVVGSSVMYDILPDLVGSLPQGKQKSELFAVYSTY